MGRQQLWVVALSDEVRQHLTAITRGQGHRARVVTRAHVLLLTAQGLLDREVAARAGVSADTVASIRMKYVEFGLEGALYEKARPKPAPKLNAQQTALLMAIADSVPAGRETWSLQRVADRLVALGVVESISDETVRRTLNRVRSTKRRMGGRASTATAPVALPAFQPPGQDERRSGVRSRCCDCGSRLSSASTSNLE